MSEVELKNVADYGKEKIDAATLNKYNYISTENLLPNRGGISTSDYLPVKGKVSKFDIGDTLVSNIRPYFKKIWHANEIGGCSNDVIVFKPNKNKIDPKFLYYQLSKDEFFDFMMSGANGTKMPRGNKNAIPTFRLNLPPLPTQKRIASILTAYDDLIENNLKRIKLLEEIAQRTYEEWFVKFRVNGEQLSIDEATGLPSGWERKKITECFSFSQHKTKIKHFEGELKYLATADVDGTLITGEGETVNWENKPSRAQIKLIKESVWFARMSKTYKVILTTSNFNQEFIISSGFAGFVPRNSYCLPFLFCVINSNDFDEKKNLFATGSTQVSLNDISLSSILVIEPEIGLIESFGKLFLSQLELRQNLIDQNQKLKQSRDILLPRLMSGTINVES